MVGNVDISRLGELGLVNKPKVEKAEVGQEQFLKLMTTQLQNQDPTKPMESGEFLGQIAQFAAVDGIQKLEKTFTGLADSLVSNQALQASSLIGRNVMVGGDAGVLQEDIPLTGALELEGRADSVTLRVMDGSGQLVRQVGLGQQPSGKIDFSWDGLNDDGESMSPGVYSFEASAVIAGEEVGVSTFANVPVQSVSIGKDGGGISVNLLGLGRRDFSEINEIR